MFAAGSGAVWYGAAAGWDELTFRRFYLFGAVLDVPVLAWAPSISSEASAGATAGPWWSGWGRRSRSASWPWPPRRADPGRPAAPGLRRVRRLPRVLAALASGLGATVVLAGAAWSAWRFWRDAELPPRAAGGPPGGRQRPRRRRDPRLGAGGLLFNSVLDEMEAFAATVLVGVALLFAGFLLATTARSPRPAGAPGPAAVAAPAAPASERRADTAVGRS
jgi:hypothetical protein